MAVKKKAKARGPVVKKKAPKKKSPALAKMREIKKRGSKQREAMPEAVSREAPEAAIEDDSIDVPSDVALAQIANLATLQLARQKKVEDAEKELKECQAQLREVQEDLLPEAMKEAGCTMFALANGAKITVKDDLSCSIDKSGEKREKAMAWLERYGLDSIIKREVSVRFGKGQEKAAEAALKALLKLKLEPEVDEGVHSSTLKATLKEVLANGILLKGRTKPSRVDVPLDLFNGHAYSKATIK